MSRIVKVWNLDYDGSSKSKRTKTKATSSGSRTTEAEKSAARPSRSREPKSVASSISVVGRPSSDGSDRHRSRSADRKRRHGADRRKDFPTPPSWQGPAVRFSHQYRLPSTRQRWLILCLCGHCYSDGWTRVRLQIPRPARLYSRQCLLPDMTQHPGDQTRCLELQGDDPGLQRDVWVVFRVQTWGPVFPVAPQNQQMTRQVTARQVTSQQMMAQHMTGRQVTGPADLSALDGPAGVTGLMNCVRLSSWCQCWKFSWKSYRTAGPVSVKSFRSYWEVLGPTNEGQRPESERHRREALLGGSGSITPPPGKFGENGAIWGQFGEFCN